MKVQFTAISVHDIDLGHLKQINPIGQNKNKIIGTDAPKTLNTPKQGVTKVNITVP